MFDAVRPQVVEEIFHDIHHVRRHIMERDGCVRATLHSLKRSEQSCIDCPENVDTGGFQ